MRQSPVVLALSPPRIGQEWSLPEDVPTLPAPISTDADKGAILREALRLRVRWVQELMGRAALELGHRFVGRGELASAEDVRYLRADDLERAVKGHAVLAHVLPAELQSEPLPAKFRLGERGDPIAVRDDATEGATGAGGGVARGIVHHDTHDLPDGAILVVRTLDPRLATVLPRVVGIICETGSVLAHVAILARESGIPIVVGAHGASETLDAGDVVEIDGTTGEIKHVEGQS